MATVSADPLKAIAYRTGIQTFSGTAPVPTVYAYEFSNVQDFSERIVRFKEQTTRFQQTLTAHSYSLRGPGDDGYDPDNPSSYISRTATASIDYTFKLVHTDVNYLADVGTNTLVTPAPFRQRDNRAGVRFQWEYDKFTTSEIASTLDVGNWSVTNFDSSGSTVSSSNGDIHPAVSSELILMPEYSTNKWYLELSRSPVMSGTSETSAAGIILPTDLEFGEQADFESSARVSAPSLSGATTIDFFIGVPSGSFPSDSDFPSGPAQFRFTQSTSITPFYTTYSL